MESVLSLQEQAYKKIAALSDRNIRLLIALADEMIQQERYDARDNISIEGRQQILQEMLEMRSRYKFPDDFDYKKEFEEALEENNA